MNTTANTLIAAFYHFTELEDYHGLHQPLLELCVQQAVKGTILLASEGVNGTIAGSPEAVHQVLNHLRNEPGLAALQHKESWASEQPFYRMKIRHKQEIVTMGISGIDPNRETGTYVPPEQWNALISDPDVLVIDTRNDYEYAIGTFRNAVNPKTNSFREFPDYVQKKLDPDKQPKVAMFCTGGIRCEKATAYMLQQGFRDVYHLQGGILGYLEKMPLQDSFWEGECFVFDNRVSVDHALNPGNYDLCHGCRHPITEQDKQSPAYLEGVSCPYCNNNLSKEKRQAATERQHQMTLARARGTQHLGPQGKNNTPVKP